MKNFIPKSLVFLSFSIFTLIASCSDSSTNSTPQTDDLNSSPDLSSMSSSVTQSSSAQPSSSSQALSSEEVVWSDSIISDFSEIDPHTSSLWSISTWGTTNRSHSVENVWIEDQLLHMKVNGGTTPGETTVGAEIVSAKSDFLYGSYRVELKSTSEAGTVVGFFYYKDDTNEIDIEFLTKDQQKAYFTIHENTGPNSHVAYNLDYKPADEFKEYRFDWFEDRVEYFIDGNLVATLDSNVPDQPGSILMNHWTLSNDAWGGGPPTNDAIIQIRKISLYFNEN